MAKLEYYELKAPLTAQVEITSRCNNRCVYCYNPWRYNKYIQKKELGMDEWNKIIDKLIQADIFEIVFTGGEPLLRKDILYQLADKCSKANISTGLNSNLTLLKHDDVKKTKNLSLKVLTSVVSYDKEKHNAITRTYSFKRVLKNIERIAAADIPLGANMVVMQENKNDVYKTGKFLHEQFGLKVFCATPISPCDLSHRKLELKPSEIENILADLIALKNEFGMQVDVLEPIPRCLVKDIKKYTNLLQRDCGAGKSTIAVSSVGEVRPCTHVERSYGNLLEESLESIWKKMKEWRDSSFLPEKCSKCAELLLCSTGCREAAKVYFDNYSAEDPWIIECMPLAKKRKISSDIIKETDKFVVSSDIKYRKDNSNYVIFSPGKYKGAIINKSFFELITLLASKKQPFDMKQIKNSIDNKIKIKNLFKFLFTHGIIDKVDVI